MEEEVQSEEAASNLEELYLPESSAPETSGQDQTHTDGPVAEDIDEDDQTKEELQEQPLTNQYPGKSGPTIQAPPTVTGSNQLEEFIILDQNGQALQCERMVIVTGQSQNGQVYVIPSNQLTASQVLLPHGQLLDIAETTGSGGQKSSSQEQLQTVTLTAIGGIAGNATIETNPNSKSSDAFVTPLKPLPRNAPSWALRLRSCEKIGDSYRGYCSTEAELEAVLLLHKQQTQAVFGTRQSPSPAKAATRLMWKSQYVPYDGIPFVNAGSRAIVMECQFGPRRKGLQPKKSSELESQSANYKATCPARIYIKKVRKFLEYRVPTDPKVDKKVVRQEQEKAFFNLKKSLRDIGGVIRYYLQLPTQKAHLYHDMEAPPLPPPPVPLPLSEDDGEGLLGPEEEEEEEADEGSLDDDSCMPSRLHPLVAEKIKLLVTQGHSQVYTVRKQLRKFVEREMFKAEKVPERHNLCYFPTVNDIKNHIHEAQKTLQQQLGCPATPADPQWAGDDLLTETVTLTLTPASMEVTPQKCAVLEGSDTLSPEAVQLFSSLSSLQPKIFAQLQGIQLQPTSNPPDGALPQHSSSSSSSSTAVPLCPGAPDLLEPSSPSLAPQPQLLIGPTSFLPSSAALVEVGGIAEPPASLLGMGQLVSVTALGGPSREGGAMHQILLEDGQTIPVQIVDPASLALTPPEDAVQVKEETEDSIINSDEPTGD